MSDIPWCASCSGTPSSAACGDVAVVLSVVGGLGDGERVSDFRFGLCGDVVGSCPFVYVASCSFVKVTLRPNLLECFWGVSKFLSPPRFY